MANIILSSHDLLGKLSIIKNSLYMLLEQPEKKEYLDCAIKTNQELIEMIKGAAQNGQNTDCR